MQYICDDCLSHLRIRRLSYCDGFCVNNIYRMVNVGTLADYRCEDISNSQKACLNPNAKCGFDGLIDLCGYSPRTYVAKMNEASQFGRQLNLIWRMISNKVWLVSLFQSGHNNFVYQLFASVFDAD